MKEILLSLARYNLWANEKVTDALKPLTPEQWRQPLGGSFTTIYDTLLHIWGAESIWWQRMKLQEQFYLPASEPHTDAAVIENLLKQSAQWLEWVENASEAALRHEFIYKTLKKETFKNPVSEMLTHLFNHGTYHRGQLVNYLRMLGVTTVPSTDFILFTRKK
jgi:uncharacterized damage-inducible protein DinB